MENSDPSSISPSAYTLLFMKRHTEIPYIREAAALVENKLRQAETAGAGPTFIPQFSTDPAGYGIFLLHFEDRYWSIDQLMADLPITNMLELSSGFSFRGLDLSRRKPVYYIDTDLPGLIAVKQSLVDDLLAGEQSAGGTPPDSSAADPTPGTPPGHYELQTLDVLDPDAFAAIVARFPPGPLVILNEGLLVYLDTTQKEQLCTNIRKALEARGGYWITADIYIRNPADNPPAGQDPAANPNPAASPSPAASEQYTQWQAWKNQFQIEQKKFSGFAKAQAFFTRMGYKIDKEATPDYPRLTSLPFLRTTAGPQFLEHLRQRGRLRLRTTWRLTLQS
ncbi:MAG TPA: hypothetical protein VKU83_03325 [Puia sp.]|nr:hypothetical protein [Puia sp.]